MTIVAPVGRIDLTPSQPSTVHLASVQEALPLPSEPRTAAPAASARIVGSGADIVEIGRLARREVEQWATRYSQAVVEIVGGDRPARQIARWSSPKVFEDLKRRAELVGRAGGYWPGEGRVHGVHPRVVGVHTCFVTEGTVEASLHVRYGRRSRALAARFERRSNRWMCTALDFS